MSIILIFLLCYSISFSQENLKEDNTIKFQELFFDGLTQKATLNYNTAVEKLMECNTLKPNQKAVLFEISKNYFQEHKLAEAIIFAKQALALDQDNIWVLEHLVECYYRDSNYKDAIVVQEKIANRYPKKQVRLVYLHMNNKDRVSALKVLNKMEQAKIINRSLRKLKKNLEQGPQKKKVVKKQEQVDIKEAFENKKSYPNLIILFKKLDKENNYRDLLKYSEEGITLFPAQSFVYLMNARANNQEKKYKKAIESLNNGFDFIYEESNKKLYFKEYIKAYNGLGDKINTKKYNNKLK